MTRWFSVAVVICLVPPAVAAQELSGPPGATANGSTTYRALSARAADIVNVKDWGAKGDGVTQDQTAINAAIAYAHGLGGTVYLPAGQYHVRTDVSGLAFLSNVALKGDGIGQTVILCDDTVASGMQNVNCGYQGAASLNNFAIRGITFQGYILSSNTAKGVLVSIAPAMTGNQYNCANISVADSEFIDSRAISLLVRYCDGVTVSGNHIAKSAQDGIAVWDSPQALITSNRLENVNDNAISAHSADAVTAPPRSGLVISGNDITESAFVSVLGAKSATITGNTMRRMLGGCLNVSASSAFAQGDTPMVGVTVADNTCTDAFKRADASPYNSSQYYFEFSGGPKAAPGTANTGPTLPTFGAAGGVGALYANNTVGSTTTPGSGFWNIRGNTLLRTLPAQSVSYTDWGYNASGLWECTNPGTVTCGYSTAAIPEANLNTPGILIDGPFRTASIAGNLISTTGTPIFFNNGSPANGDWDGVSIRDNKLSDWCATAGACAQAGVYFNPNSAVYERVEISGNEFDGDPRVTASNRGSNGTWANTNPPFGINLNGTVSGVTIARNSFRNVTNPIQGYGTPAPFLSGNIAYANPAGGAGCHNNSNVGIDCVPQAGPDWAIVQEDANPNSATWGKMLTAPTASAAAMPASGTWVQGTFVANNTPSLASGNAVIGWLRLTTGAGNVAGTDWAALYGSNAAVGMVLISTQTASNSATLQWTGLSGYRNYRLVCSNLVPVTNGVFGQVQLGEGGGPTWEAGAGAYAYQGFNFNSAAAFSGTTTAFAVEKNGVANTAGYGITFTAELTAASSTTEQKGAIVNNLYPALTAETVMSTYTADTGAVTAYRFLFSSGNISTGQCSLYGSTT